MAQFRKVLYSRLFILLGLKIVMLSGALRHFRRFVGLPNQSSSSPPSSLVETAQNATQTAQNASAHLEPAVPPSTTQNVAPSGTASSLFARFAFSSTAKAAREETETRIEAAEVPAAGNSDVPEGKRQCISRGTDSENWAERVRESVIAQELANPCCSMSCTHRLTIAGVRILRIANARRSSNERREHFVFTCPPAC